MLLVINPLPTEDDFRDTGGHNSAIYSLHIIVYICMTDQAKTPVN